MRQFPRSADLWEVGVQQAVVLGRCSMKRRLVSTAVGFALAFPLVVSASTVRTVTATSGLRSASAVFTLTGSSLQVELTNNGTRPTLVGNDSIYVLTALFFTVPSPVTLTPVSAVLGSGSSLVTNGMSVNASELASNWVSNSLGISSTGLGLFGGGDKSFAADNAIAGGHGSPSWGIGGAGFVPGNGAGNNPYVVNKMVFTLSVDGSLDLGLITGFGFQYGTSLADPLISPLSAGPLPVPSPAASLAGGAALATLLARRRS